MNSNWPLVLSNLGLFFYLISDVALVARLMKQVFLLGAGLLL